MKLNSAYNVISNYTNKSVLIFLRSFTEQKFEKEKIRKRKPCWTLKNPVDFNSDVNTLIVFSSLRTVLSSAFRPRSSYFTTEQSNKLFVPQRQFARICSQEHSRMFPKASAIKFTIHIVDTHVCRKTTSFHSSTSSSRGSLHFFHLSRKIKRIIIC